MASDSIQRKADRYLTEGRVLAVYLTLTGGDFLVNGSAPEPYKVHFLGEWTCSCPAQIVCAHIVACQKITRFEPARQIMFADPEDELSAFLHEALHGR